MTSLLLLEFDTWTPFSKIYFLTTWHHKTYTSGWREGHFTLSGGIDYKNRRRQPFLGVYSHADQLLNVVTTLCQAKDQLLQFLLEEVICNQPESLKRKRWHTLRKVFRSNYPRSSVKEVVYRSCMHKLLTLRIGKHPLHQYVFLIRLKG